MSGGSFLRLGYLMGLVVISTSLEATTFVSTDNPDDQIRTSIRKTETYCAIEILDRDPTDWESPEGSFFKVYSAKFLECFKGGDEANREFELLHFSSKTSGSSIRKIPGLPVLEKKQMLVAALEEKEEGRFFLVSWKPLKVVKENGELKVIRQSEHSGHSHSHSRKLQSSVQKQSLSDFRRFVEDAEEED